MLCATGVFICIEGVLGIVDQAESKIPGSLAIWAAALTAVIKLALYKASIRVGRRTNSPTLLASARDHRADVVSSLVALTGIWIARNGYPAFDAIAGIVIGIYIFYLSFEPLRNNTDILMHAAPPDLVERAQLIAADIDGVRGVNQVRVQPLGGLYRMDMSVAVDGHVTVDAAHTLAHTAEDEIRRRLPEITEVHVHVEPADTDGPTPGPTT
jgi:cation diffusion facilitator family transporter